MLVRLLAIMKPAETIFRCYILYYNTKKRGGNPFSLYTTSHINHRDFYVAGLIRLIFNQKNNNKKKNTRDILKIKIVLQ